MVLSGPGCTDPRPRIREKLDAETMKKGIYISNSGVSQAILNSSQENPATNKPNKILMSFHISRNDTATGSTSGGHWCRLCMEIFPDIKQWRKHVVNSHPASKYDLHKYAIYRCAHCPFSSQEIFPNVELLCQHVTKMHSLTCELCTTCFSTEQELLAHWYNSHQNLLSKIQPCRKCTWLLAQGIKEANHRHVWNLFMCSRCNYMCRGYSKLALHIYEKHLEQICGKESIEFLCRGCDTVFSGSSLELHLTQKECKKEMIYFSPAEIGENPISKKDDQIDQGIYNFHKKENFGSQVTEVKQEGHSENLEQMTTFLCSDLPSDSNMTKRQDSQKRGIQLTKTSKQKKCRRDFSCAWCPVACENWSELAKHTQKSHPKLCQPCEYCNYALSKPNGDVPAGHRHDNYIYRCPACIRICNSFLTLKKHMFKTHICIISTDRCLDNCYYLCKRCSQVFPAGYKLEKHLSDKCQTTDTLATSTLISQKIQSGDIFYKCPLCLGIIPQHQGELHAAQRHPKKNFEYITVLRFTHCTICQKLVNVENMPGHYLSMHGMMAFICSRCKTISTSSQDIVQHMEHNCADIDAKLNQGASENGGHTFHAKMSAFPKIPAIKPETKANVMAIKFTSPQENIHHMEYNSADINTKQGASENEASPEIPTETKANIMDIKFKCSLCPILVVDKVSQMDKHFLTFHVGKRLQYTQVVKCVFCAKFIPAGKFVVHSKTKHRIEIENIPAEPPTATNRKALMIKLMGQEIEDQEVENHSGINSDSQLEPDSNDETIVSTYQDNVTQELTFVVRRKANSDPVSQYSSTH